MNNVCLIGRLASDPSMSEAGGKRKAWFRLAVPRTRDEAEFFSVTAWENTANIVERHCQKGDRVGVQGRLSSREYEDKFKQRRESVEVVAHRVDFAGTRGSAPEPAGAVDDDMPF